LKSYAWKVQKQRNFIKKFSKEAKLMKFQRGQDIPVEEDIAPTRPIGMISDALSSERL